MSLYLRIGGERHVAIKLEFTLRNIKKTWHPFFFGPSPEEMPNACWFGGFGFDVMLSKNNGKGFMDCHYAVANDYPRCRSVFSRTERIYDAYEIGGDRWELIDTIDNAGVVTKYRDGWLDHCKKAEQESAQA